MADLPYVEQITTNGLDPESDVEKWAALVDGMRNSLRAQIPIPHQPSGDVTWEELPDYPEPTPPGQHHYRFIQHYTQHR